MVLRLVGDYLSLRAPEGLCWLVRENHLGVVSVSYDETPQLFNQLAQSCFLTWIPMHLNIIHDFT